METRKSKDFSWALGKTTDADIEKAETLEMDIISKILSEMESDTENESGNLLLLYKAANEEERAIMDNMLIFICGWTLNSIISDIDREIRTQGGSCYVF